MNHHHQKHRHHRYTFKNFMSDVSKPFITVEKDINGTIKHVVDKVGPSAVLGLSIVTPIIIVGVGIVGIYLISKK